MKKLSHVVAVVSLLALAQMDVALAGDDFWDRRGGNRQDRFADRVDSRQDKQWDRIRDGRTEGSLNRKESRILHQDQHRIADLEDRFGKDGRVNGHERHIIERAQDRASEHIFKARHNGYYRGERHDRGHHYGWEKHKHYSHKPHSIWGHHGHTHYVPRFLHDHGHGGRYVERHRIYVPAESSRFDLNLHFRDVSAGVSGSRQF